MGLSGKTCYRFSRELYDKGGKLTTTAMACTMENVMLRSKSPKFHRKPAPPDLPEAPGVPPGLNTALGMDLGWFGEGHMRSSMVNNSKFELFGTHPRIPTFLTFPRVPTIGCHQPRLGTTL